MANAAKQKPLVVRGCKETHWNGRDEELYVQTQNSYLQEPSTQNG